MTRTLSGCGVTRRSMLQQTGMGFTGLALSALMADEAKLRPDREPHFPAKAKSVIWIFLCGGVSHVESFDPKPMLTKYAGKSIEDTPFKSVLKSEKRDVVAGNPVHGNRKTLMALQTGYKKYGRSGLEVGDWWKNIGGCADELAVVRSLYTTDNDHGAQLQFPHGASRPRGGVPDGRIVGDLRPRLGEPEFAGLRRVRPADRRLLRRRVDARGRIPRPRIRGRPHRTGSE